jgi:ATP-dependent DNA helicase RecG
MKPWIAEALRCLAESLAPLPHELNELDWKARLSDHKERLSEHLIAFANHSNGGFLVFGINDDGQPVGVDDHSAEHIIRTLTNLGRDAVEPALALDHAVVDHPNGTPILLVRIPEQVVKPVHRRGKSIEESWVRSGGTTRKASRQEIAGLMLNSEAPRWEDLRASPLLELADVQQRLDLGAIARLLQRPLPEDANELARWLADEGITVPDGRGYYITNFGAIAAARNLDDFPSLKRKKIRVIRYRNTNKIETIDELTEHQGYAIGSTAC